MDNISADVNEKRDTRSQASALVAKLYTLDLPFVSQSYKHDLQRTRKRKSFSDDTDPVVVLNGRKKLRIKTFNVVIDKLMSCLEYRLDAYKHLADLFGVLFMFDHSNSAIKSKATAFCAAYPSDLDICLVNELIHFRAFVPDQQLPTKMLQTLLHLDLQSIFPNVYIAVRIFLTLPVTNCEGERSFSHLARIKNELRTRMGQRRLCSLSLLAIECELVNTLDFNDVVDDFARSKASKRLL